jgi:hypothetical protein
MRKTAERSAYHPTESKYKGGAHEMYITYDLEQATRGGGHATYPKVKRVYIAGDVKTWQVGDFRRRTGREVHGVKIDYEQTREGYHRGGYSASRGARTYQVPPADVRPATQRFSQVVEVPDAARNIQFHREALPERYREALQDVR